MNIARRARRFLALALATVVVILTAGLASPALAGPRSGSSFGGRLGFRSGGGMSAPGYSGGGYSSPGYSSPGYGYGSGYGYGGPRFFFFPGFGGYGFGTIGPLLGVVIVGLAVASVVRAVRTSRRMGTPGYGYGDDDDGGQVVAMPGRAYLYRLQLALGRSARGIQERLADFATRGDTSTEAGLTALLQQTALELLREKDAVRYAGAEGRGPMSLTNAETAMNGLALAERGRFQIERIRGADGRVSRSEAPAEEGREALELIVVTILAATRTPLEKFGQPSGPEELGALLSELGGVSPDAMLGLEVVWTPADPNDSMTETDVMTTYPELRSL